MIAIPTIEEKKSVESNLLRIMRDSGNELDPKELIEKFQSKYDDSEDDYSIRSLIWHLIDTGKVTLTIDRKLKLVK